MENNLKAKLETELEKIGVKEKQSEKELLIAVRSCAIPAGL